MARKELTKNAREIADLIYCKAAKHKHKTLADSIGLSESQFGRSFSQNVEMVAVIIDLIGIELVDGEELDALRVLARKALGK